MGYSRKNPPFGGSFAHGTWVAAKYHDCPCVDCEAAYFLFYFEEKAIREEMLAKHMKAYKERIESIVG